MGFDRAVLQLMVDYRTGWVTALTGTVADVGMSTAAYVGAVVLCMVFGWVFRAWRPALAAPVAGLVAVGVADLAKGVIGRPRPPHELALLTSDGFSMPSSIAALTAGAALPVILVGVRRGGLVGRALIAVLAIATLAVGVSMVYLGAHWLSDVLAGWALGGAIGAAAFRLIAGPVRSRVPSTR